MAEVETPVTPVETPAPAGELDPAAVKALLDKRGLKDISQLDGILDTYKGDLGTLKTENKDLKAIKAEYETLKADAETRRQAELTETQKLQEMNEKKDKDLAELQGKIKQMEKSQLKDRVLFKHGKDKPLLGTRMKLYEVAAKTKDWENEEQLQAVFAEVDTEFDAELKALNIQLPAPGDGDGGKGGGSDSKFDQKYIDNLFKKKKT